MHTRSLFGFKFASNLEGIRDNLCKKYKIDQAIRHAKAGNTDTLDFSWINELASEDHPTVFYYIDPRAANVAQLIDLHPFQLNWLCNFSDGYFQFNYGDSFIKWKKEGCHFWLLCGNHYHAKGAAANSRYFMLPVKGTFTEIAYMLRGEPETEIALRLFLQLLCFLIMAPVECTHLDPGERYLNKKNPYGLKNTEKVPIVHLHCPQFYHMAVYGKLTKLKIIKKEGSLWGHDLQANQ